MYKRVLKCGEERMTICAETGNACFGRTVYEDLNTGDLGVIVNLATGEVFVDVDTFLDCRFFDDVEIKPEIDITMILSLYGTGETVIAHRIDVTAYNRDVWESDEGARYVVVEISGDRYFMPLVDFVDDRRYIERVEAGLI